jgi:hypothetical protein
VRDRQAQASHMTKTKILSVSGPILAARGVRVDCSHFQRSGVSSARGLGRDLREICESCARDLAGDLARAVLEILLEIRGMSRDREMCGRSPGVVKERIKIHHDKTRADLLGLCVALAVPGVAIATSIGVEP